jgi:hypothetical protein
MHRHSRIIIEWHIQVASLVAHGDSYTQSLECLGINLGTEASSLDRVLLQQPD